MALDRKQLYKQRKIRKFTREQQIERQVLSAEVRRHNRNADFRAEYSKNKEFREQFRADGAFRDELKIDARGTINRFRRATSALDTDTKAYTSSSIIERVSARTKLGIEKKLYGLLGGYGEALRQSKRATTSQQAKEIRRDFLYRSAANFIENRFGIPGEAVAQRIRQNISNIGSDDPRTAFQSIKKNFTNVSDALEDVQKQIQRISKANDRAFDYIRKHVDDKIKALGKDDLLVTIGQDLNQVQDRLDNLEKIKKTNVDVTEVETKVRSLNADQENIRGEIVELRNLYQALKLDFDQFNSNQSGDSGGAGSGKGVRNFLKRKQNPELANPASMLSFMGMGGIGALLGRSVLGRLGASAAGSVATRTASAMSRYGKYLKFGGGALAGAGIAYGAYQMGAFDPLTQEADAARGKKVDEGTTDQDYFGIINPWSSNFGNLRKNKIWNNLTGTNTRDQLEYFKQQRDAKNASPEKKEGVFGLGGFPKKTSPNQSADDRIYKNQIDQQKSQFMQFGKLPPGFEFISGHMGRLGSAAAVAARGAQPLSGDYVQNAGGVGTSTNPYKSGGGWTPEKGSNDPTIIPPTIVDPNDPIGTLVNVKGRLDPQGSSTESEFLGPKGMGSPFNWAETPEGKKALGGPSQNLTTIVAPISGKKFTVNKAVAENFLGFITEAEQRGYKIDPGDSHGHAHRGKAGGGGMSMHAYGNAIDLNAGKNPFSKWAGYKPGATDMPENMKYLAMKHGLVQLGNDRMHFEAVSPEYRKLYAERLLKYGMVKKDDPIVQQWISKGYFDQKYVDAIRPETPDASTRQQLMSPQIQVAAGVAGPVAGPAADLSKIDPNALKFIRSIGARETGFQASEAASERYNQESNNSNVRRFGAEGRDYGYFQTNRRDVQDAIRRGVPKEIAEALDNGGGKGNYTVEQQTAAMDAYLQKLNPAGYEAAKRGDWDAANRAFKGKWPSLPGGLSYRPANDRKAAAALAGIVSPGMVSVNQQPTAITNPTRTAAPKLTGQPAFKPLSKEELSATNASGADKAFDSTRVAANMTEDGVGNLISPPPLVPDDIVPIQPGRPNSGDDMRPEIVPSPKPVAPAPVPSNEMEDSFDAHINNQIKNMTPDLNYGERTGANERFPKGYNDDTTPTTTGGNGSRHVPESRGPSPGCNGYGAGNNRCWL